MHAVGIDIGGTKIAGALVDEQGQIHNELKVSSPIDDADQMLETIASLVAELTAGQVIAGVGVAAAGFMSKDREIMYHAPNISAWRNEPLKKRLETKLGQPVMLENDANAAGWAEFRFGAGAKSSSMIMITIGTGLGGAIISDGVLLKGGFGIGGALISGNAADQQQAFGSYVETHGSRPSLHSRPGPPSPCSPTVLSQMRQGPHHMREPLLLADMLRNALRRT